MRYKAGARSEGGAGSLAVVLLLLSGATLLWGYANRTLLLELRSSAATVRATVAAEAAEAGLAWAVARLNDPTPIDDRCGANVVSGTRFVDRVLPLAAEPSPGRMASAVQAGCVRTPAGWACQCATAPAAVTGTAPTPAFLLSLGSHVRPGLAWLHSDGCSHAAAPCTAGGGRADAHRRVSVLIGLLSALPRPPYAAVTAVGPVQTVGAVTIVNAAPGTSWTVAGSSTTAFDPLTRLVGAPGQPGGATVAPPDPRGLQGGAPVPAARWFALHFALSTAAYRALPHVGVLTCAAACAGNDVEQAWQAGWRVLWVDGDLLLDRPSRLGTRADPLLLVVTGTLRISASVTLTGYLHAAAVDWSAPAGSLQGALNSAGPARLEGALQITRDDAVLARLRDATGTWAPLPGGWHAD